MNETGTKLSCSTCGAQVVVTKGGQGVFACHSSGMEALVGSGGGGVASDQAAEGGHYDPFYD